MIAITNKLQIFIHDLRMSGLSISPAEAEDCYRSLLLLDWSNEEIFYTSLLATLLKEQAFMEVFNKTYKKHFHAILENHDIKNLNTEQLDSLNNDEENSSIALDSLFANKKTSGGQKIIKKSNVNKDKEKNSNNNPKRKDFFELDFYTATYSAPLEDLKRMEELIPLLAKKLASKLVIKKRRNDNKIIDYRKTLRQNMDTGGVLIDLYSKKKLKEKPEIFALCDVSWSCLYFSYFSLAIVYLLEKFFREVRSFAFIGESDEITSIIRSASYEQLRMKVLSEANVSGSSGYTNYGESLETFYNKYGQQLTHKTNVLIFGDARTNWFATNPRTLEQITKRVKRVYWFNPEPKDEWGRGDSEILVYQRYCNRVFECSNLNQLANAISELV